jgi:hypothetical protein
MVRSDSIHDPDTVNSHGGLRKGLSVGTDEDGAIFSD